MIKRNHDKRNCWKPNSFEVELGVLMSFNEINITFDSRLNSRKKYSLRKTSHGTRVIPFPLRIITFKTFSTHMQSTLCVSE